MNGNGDMTSTFEKAVRLTKELGFPALVTVVLLYVLLNQMPLLTQSITNFTVVMAEIKTVLVEQTRELRDHRARSEVSK